MSLSRREFFGSAGAALTPTVTVVEVPPKKAYVIMGQSWNYNDEVTSEGDAHLASSSVYYDKALADADCQRMIEEFEKSDTPDSFEVDWEWLGDHFTDEQMEHREDITWSEVYEAGLNKPFWVSELTHEESKHAAENTQA